LPAERRLKGDALAEMYIRAAATAARRLPPEHAAGGFLTGLGIALDDSPVLRNNPGTAKLCKYAESDDERKQRLAVLGSPTLRGRRDLCQHFCVSCALTEVVGPGLARTIGLLKEEKDMRGGTGFSFCDMSANLAGIRLGELLKQKHLTLEKLAKDFLASSYLIDPKGLKEGMNVKQFTARYGSFEDRRFKDEMMRVEELVHDLPGHRTR
jgi:hypothetical protein